MLDRGGDLLDETALLPALTPQITSRPPSEIADHVGSYGYGFNVGPWSSGPYTFGHSVAFVLGSATAFTLIPSADAGIVTLTNATPVGVPEALNAEFTDLVLTGELGTDWWDFFSASMAPLTAGAGDLAGQEAPSAPAPAQDLSAYIGDYSNDYFGTLSITESDDGLVGALGPDGQYQFPLTHWDGDTFAFTPTGENAPNGSQSSALFDPDAGTVTVNFFDNFGLGTWQR